MKFLVGRVDEIPPGTRKIVRVAGRSIGVFNVDGDFYAIRNRCPHQGAPLCEGKLWGTLFASRPGEFDYQPGKHILACIWHGWEFDLRTGQSWCEPQRLRVRSYSVDVTEQPADLPVAAADAVKNRLITTANPPPAPGMVEGPYTVPTYATTVEGGCVYLTVEVE
jgi:3-phenylpropionate/trans-cinnamate dioxygenase ferredoxin subunit